MAVSSLNSIIRASEDSSVCKCLHQIYKDVKDRTISVATKERIEHLPDQIKQNIFLQIENLKHEPFGYRYGEIHVLDDPDLLQKAIEIVAGKHFSQLDFSKKTSLYQHLLNIYEDAKRGNLSEITLFEISLLPNEIYKEIFSNIYDAKAEKLIAKFDEIEVINNPKDLEKAIEKVAIGIFQKFNASEQSYFEYAGRIEMFPSPDVLFKRLDRIKELLIFDHDVGTFIQAIRQNVSLCKATPFFISRLNIKEEADRIQIAKLCASQYGWATSKFIQDFGIKTETALVEIAILCAHQNNIGTALFIQNFGIKQIKDLVKIALILSGNATGWEQIRQLIQSLDIVDQKDLIEVATFCAQHDSRKTVQFIRNLGIKEEKARIEIAKICAEQDSFAAAHCIQHFDIEDQKALTEIAILCAKNNSIVTASFIQNFKIEDENNRIQIARFCSTLNAMATAQFIHKFNIKNERALAEIAILCAKDNCKETIQCIENFDIKDENVLIEICKLYGMKKYDQVTHENIVKKFTGYIGNKNCIEHEKVLIEFAKSCALQNGEHTARLIKKFGVQNQIALVEIALLCAAQNWKMILYIDNFDIQDEKALIKIVELCIQKCHDLKHMRFLIASIIEKFTKSMSFKDEETLIKIAEICAKKHGKETARCIKQFHFYDEKTRIEIALLCAKQTDQMVPYIQNFAIQDQEALIEIAKICARQYTFLTINDIDDFDMRGSKHALTAGYIQKFGICNEEALIEIAKICAQQHPDSTAKHITNFAIKKQEALIEIATECAKQDSLATAQFIQNFEITDQHALIKIAIICAQQNPLIAQFIQNFAIEDEKARVEIAKICAKQDAWQTALYIKCFKIEDKTALVEMAKICAAKDGLQTALHIQNFDIQDEKKLIEIARRCIEQNNDAASAIWDFCSVQSTKFPLLGSLCIFISPKKLIRRIPGQKDAKTGSLKRELNAMQNPAKSMGIANPCLEDLQHFLLTSTQAFTADHLNPNSYLQNQISKCIIQLKSVHAIEQASSWIASMLYFLSILSSSEQGWMIKAELFETLFSIQSPVLRQNLSSLLIEFALSPNAFKVYFEEQLALDKKIADQEKLMSDREKRRQEKLEKKISQQSNLMLEQEKEEQDEFNQAEEKGVVKVLPKQAKEKKVLDFVLGALQIAGISKKATDHVKSIFSLVFKGRTEIHPLLEMLYLLNSSVDISAKKKEVVLQLLCEGAIKGPTEKGQDYTKRLAKLKPELKQRAFALLAIFLFKNETLLENSSSILKCAKETFKEKLGIDARDDSFAAFQKSFKTERSQDAITTYAAKLFSLDEPQVMDDLKRYICSVMDNSFHEERYKLQNNPHLEKIAQGSLDILEAWKSSLQTVTMAFFAEDENQNRFEPRLWLQNKVEHRHFEPNSLPHLQALLEQNEVNENTLLPIEKNLKTLLESKDKQAQIACLEAIQIELQSFKPCQFQRDVSDQLLLLRRSASSLKEKVEVVDTDDYQDLLLCGTEVVGSCQNVNGNPNFNKGLLGYILDGKNRLIAVKNSQGKILARAKLSILLDAQNKPVLYLESLYSQEKFTLQCYKAIVDQALLKAGLLGIPLTASIYSVYRNLDQVIASPFEHPLFSHGGGVSYEYVDASRGIQDGGIYQIEKDEIVILSSKSINSLILELRALFIKRAES